jgi:hypothetical protein
MDIKQMEMLNNIYKQKAVVTPEPVLKSSVKLCKIEDSTCEACQ